MSCSESCNDDAIYSVIAGGSAYKHVVTYTRVVYWSAMWWGNIESLGVS